ncbi:protein ECERIFERUM 26-like [Telopea speciosissima]|uniref:protein ECERIFERUM 26-like n=1 Tax=Telopea speciosissima TaxID=54955 RepID=UPI001CC803FC|nr:protein ECERIFERUM 26-like [Telopea speciosissima]
MVVPDNTKGGNMIFDMRLSSVVPARLTGTDVIHEPINMDLAMKLHYVRAVYYFRSSLVVEGFGVYTVKEALFRWFNLYSHSCGRFNRSESGRPFIKCNDCGARFIEAKCSKSLDEWLEMESLSLHNLLVSNQVLGPDLDFSPLVLIQMTTFKCGGKALGFSWAHVLGDAFSLSEFLNLLGQIMSGHHPPNSPTLPKPAESKATNKPNNPQSFLVEPLSVKRVEPVGDHWIAANNCKMENYSFHITAQQLKAMSSKKFFPTTKIPLFESLSAVFWQCLARVREGSEPKTLTICRNREKEITNLSSNKQTINTVQVDFSVTEADPNVLAEMIMESQKVDETNKIEEMVEQDQGLSDLIIYGANLTFVDLEKADLYGLELKKQKPSFVNYTIDGVGDEGLILVMKDHPGNVNGDEGRTVTVILPENQILKLKDELGREWSIA